MTDAFQKGVEFVRVEHDCISASVQRNALFVDHFSGFGRLVTRFIVSLLIFRPLFPSKL